ncbi:unnamed protein product [Agarophyton chilense]
MGRRPRPRQQIPLADVKPTARKRVSRANQAAHLSYVVLREVIDATILQTDAPGVLQPQNDLEHTYHFMQQALRPHVNIATAANADFQLRLDDSGLAPYHTACFSRYSRSLWIASRLGPVSMLD